MILLDAYALLAFVQDEPAAPEVEQLIRSGEGGVSAVNLTEVVDGLLRRQRWPEEEVVAKLGLVVGDLVPVTAVTETVAWKAGSLRSRYYSRSTCELSLADCILLASAREDDAVASADTAVAAVARAEGITFVPLPHTSGQRP